MAQYFNWITRVDRELRTHKLPGAVRNVVNASTLFSARSSRNPLPSARSSPSHCQLGTSLFLADVASV